MPCFSTAFVIFGLLFFLNKSLDYHSESIGNLQQLLSDFCGTDFSYPCMWEPGLDVKRLVEATDAHGVMAKPRRTISRETPDSPTHKNFSQPGNRFQSLILPQIAPGSKIVSTPPHHPRKKTPLWAACFILTAFLKCLDIYRTLWF